MSLWSDIRLEHPAVVMGILLAVILLVNSYIFFLFGHFYNKFFSFCTCTLLLDMYMFLLSCTLSSILYYLFFLIPPFILMPLFIYYITTTQYILPLIGGNRRGGLFLITVLTSLLVLHLLFALHLPLCLSESPHFAIHISSQQWL